MLLLGPLGLNWNEVIWPWNIGVVLLLWILFPVNTVLPPSFQDQTSSVRRFVPFYIIVLLLGILPVLSFFGRWDYPLSMTMYSGITDEAAVYFDKEDRSCFPSWIDEEKIINIKDARFIELNDWSMDELKIPFYSRKLIFKKMGRQLCECLSKPENGGVRIFSIAGRWDRNINVEDFSCEKLKLK